MYLDRSHTIECREANHEMDDPVCPSLILDKKVVCDAAKVLFQPNSRMVKESCTNERYIHCPLRSSRA